MPGVVIAGAGQAGFQLAVSLRTEGFAESITLIGDEPELPYNRPPLSKAFLMGQEPEEDLPFRPASFFEEHHIRMLMGVRVTAIDRLAKSVHLHTSESIPYETLVLATGARVRPITLEPVPGLIYLRTVADARDFKERLVDTPSLIAIGAGFIGLEAAAAGSKLGKRVTVIAAEDRPMSRVVSPIVSDYFLNLHQRHNVELHLNKLVDRIEPGLRVLLQSGKIVESPLVIAGIGVTPNIDLAESVGVAVSNGITVDRYLRTADDSIFAIGDCASHPNRFSPEPACRLESVQNAVDQARCVAATIAGKPRAYEMVPWFWTEQFDAKLQIAGLPYVCDEYILRGTPATGAFSVFGFRNGALAAVESVNRPVDHIQARKMLELGAPLTQSQAADPSFDLKPLARPQHK